MFEFSPSFSEGIVATYYKIEEIHTPPPCPSLIFPGFYRGEQTKKNP